MVKPNIQVSFIELIETQGEKHHEERIMGETFQSYPSFREGDVMHLTILEQGELKPSLRLTAYRIIEVHHSLRAKKMGKETFADFISNAGMEVYLRKID